MATSDINAFFEVLSHAECIECLQKEEVGRLAWVSDGQPTIVPVNYAWDGEAVVMRSDPGIKLNQLRDADVAFEIDRIDRARKEGWSVVVRGRAQEVSVDDWPRHAMSPDQLCRHESILVRVVVVLADGCDRSNTSVSDARPREAQARVRRSRGVGGELSGE